MKYEVVPEWNDMEFGGSGMVGEIKTSVYRLVELFGNPIEVNSQRIGLRWLIRFEDGTRATIFNNPKDSPDTWCVGGFGDYDKKTKENLSLRAVKQLLDMQ